MNREFFSSTWRTAAGALFAAALGLVAAAPSSAQTSFEYVYGGGSSMELGLRGVTPVSGPNVCSSNGYVAVGLSRSGGTTPSSDVYVVRTNSDGSRQWEYTYDLSGNGSSDTAYSVKVLPDGSGFIVTGSTVQGSGTTDAFLLKINCDGSIGWEMTYGDTTRNDAGHDVITASPLGTGAVDFIVCGYTSSASGARTAYLFRTDDAGNLLWDNTYDNNSQVEWFSKLIQAAPTGTQTQGDIVAVGTHHNGQGFQGFIVRCSSVTGAISAFDPNHGAADYGINNTINEELFSVVELPTGDLVAVGYTDDGPIVNGFGTRDIYLARTNGRNPTALAVQTQLGDNGFFNELGYDVILTDTSMRYTGTGNLVVVGTSNVAGSYDAIMVAVNPSTLARRLGTVRRFGDIGRQRGDDIGYSLHEVKGWGTTNALKPGFIICGTSRSNLGNPSPADPGDLYLIKTDDLGSTECDSTMLLTNSGYSVDPVILVPTEAGILASQSRNPSNRERTWPQSVCTSVGKQAIPEAGEPLSATTPAPGSVVRSFPNPVKSGEVASMTFTPSTSTELIVSITDMAGKSVGVR